MTGGDHDTAMAPREPPPVSFEGLLRVAALVALGFAGYLGVEFAIGEFFVLAPP